jgi:hypothetical protein
MSDIDETIKIIEKRLVLAEFFDEELRNDTRMAIGQIADSGVSYDDPAVFEADLDAIIGEKRNERQEKA